MDGNPFDTLSDHERATLALALTLFVMEANVGLVAGPFPATQLERDMPVAFGLFNKIGLSFTGGPLTLDPDLIATYSAAVSQKAAEEREHGQA
jgi:hypothetical protein